MKPDLRFELSGITLAAWGPPGREAERQPPRRTIRLGEELLVSASP